MNRLAIHLHPRAERAVKREHPWVYAEGIRQLRREGRAGDLAVIFDERDRFLAIGLYDPASPIRIRVLHRGRPETIDAAWFAARLRAAWERRAPLREEATTAFRMVHGENDGLPGLVVDRYASSLVVKLYTAAWFPHLEAVLAGLEALLPVQRVVLRLSRAVQREAGAPATAPDGPAQQDSRTPGYGQPLHDGQILRGPELEGPVLFQENGLTFEADLVHGQKTGFFLDQRDNRARVEAHAGGRTVLNVFSYTGGFSVYAARGGAREVVSLDASGPALAAAERNFGHNRTDPTVAAARHRTLEDDAFALLPELAGRGERFDVVILDPPSFAKAQAEVPAALVSYARLLGRGLDVLAPGGLLVAASCSSRITAEAFGDLVVEAGGRARRPLTVLEQTGHPLDHPIGFPEGAYLKCVFARADE
ncbi:MAG: class I SAM-dependent rRNA methyltransferase [Gemmatimonadota bacterium]